MYKSLDTIPCHHDLMGETTFSCWRFSVERKNALHTQPYKMTDGGEFTDAEVNAPIQDLCSQERISELVQLLEKDPRNLEAVSEFVQKHNGKWIKWENDDDYLRLCDLSSTIYMGQTFMQESWEKCYLPKETRMQVLGTMESAHMHPCVDWIILLGEDRRIYAYGQEEMQLIAKSLSEFVKNGKREIYSSYYYPQSSNEDESVEHDEEILKIRQRARDFVNKSAKEFDYFLSNFSSNALPIKK